MQSVQNIVSDFIASVSQLTVGHGSKGSRGSWVSRCDPLTDYKMNQIPRTISITFGSRLVERVTFVTVISLVTFSYV